MSKKNSNAEKFLAISKKIDKEITEYGSTLKSSIYSNIDEWVDTGSYSLNRLITGDIFKGIPRGRIVALAGDSGVGKSFLSGMCIKNAQEMGYTVIVYDTENAIDNDFMERIGVDTEALIYFRIEVIEDFRNHAINTCKQFLEENPEEKVMIVLDSFGNLSCAKEKRDVEAGKDASDMGQRSKAGASMIKEMTHFCGKMKVPFLLINHTYKDTASAANPMYAKDVMKGGKAPLYMSSVVIMLRKTSDKDDNKQKKGSIIRMKSEKNRLARDEQSAEMYLSFSTGPNRFYGLLDDAIEAGLIEKQTGWYFVKHLEKKVREKEIWGKLKKEVFNEQFLKDLNVYCNKKYKYATINYSDESVDEALEQDLDETYTDE